MNEYKTVLVTGGSGFVGGMVCRLLVDSGFDVINIDRVKREIPGVTQYPFDLDNHQVKGVIKLIRPDTIIHLAAETGVRQSMNDPATYYGNNVVNSITLLNHAIEFGVKNFIFSSSSTVYGDYGTDQTAEDRPLNPISPYGRSKAIIESILDDYNRVYNLNYASLRYFNVAGADPSGHHGYTDNPPNHIIPILAKHVVKGSPVTIYNGFDSADGTAVRNYTHLYDIASAHLSAMNYLEDGGESGAFNLGGDRSFSVLEVIRKFEEIANTKIEYTVDSKKDGEVKYTSADTSKAQKCLGWSPMYTLDDMITHAINWEIKRK